MSRATVREAIASYLESADIPYLTSVKRFPAKFTPEGDFYQDDDPGHQSGAIMFLYFASQSENRIAVGGEHNGRKSVLYSVVLDCFLRSSQAKAQDASIDNETFVDSILDAIRANRTANSNGIIFQWGEGATNGSNDIDVVTYYPKMLRGGIAVTQTYSSIRVNVVEILDT